MPETQSTRAVMDIVNSVGRDAFPKSVPEQKIEAEALHNLRKVTAPHHGKVMEDGKMVDVFQNPTPSEVGARISEIFDVKEGESAKVSKEALKLFDQLSRDAKEKLGVDNAIDGSTMARKVEVKHARIENRKKAIARQTIDIIAADKLGSTQEVVKLDWKPFAEQANIDVTTVTANDLKQSPVFEEYRDQLVTRMQDLSKQLEPVSVKENWKKPGKIISNLWNRFKFNSAYAEMFDSASTHKKDLLVQLDNATALTNDERGLSFLPSLDEAKKYSREYSNFKNRAGFVADNEDLLDAMGSVQSDLLGTFNKGFDNQYMLDWDKAIAEDLTFEKNKAEKQQVQLDQDQKEVGLRLAMLEQESRERMAGKELNSLSMEAMLFANAAEKDAEIAGKGLALLAEYQHKEGKIAEFDAKIKDGSFGEFQEIINADYAQEVNLFIESKGKKGDYKAVEKLFNSLDKVITKSFVQDGVSTSFISLNNLSEGNKSIETGLLAGFAEDGSWEIKFATRDGEQIIESNPELPVIRLQPESILASLKLIEVQNESIKSAQQDLAREQVAAKLVGGTAENRKAHKAALNAAQASVTAFTSALNASKLELATKLQATDTVKTLGGALKEMSDAQSQVAEAFYSQDYNEMINDFASELNLKPSQVTPEVLATIATSAEYASDRANEMSNYFTEVATPGLIEAKVMKSAEPWIMNMAFDYTRLQEDETRAKSFNDPALESQAVKVINKRKIALQKQAKELAQVLNQELINATPEAFRKGSKAIGMTKSELKKSVAETLRFSGFDADNYQKSTESRPVTVAQRTYDILPYDSELKAISDKAIDVMRDMGTTSMATQNLIDSLEGGDVDMFMSQINNAQAIMTEAEVNARSNEADSRKLKELLSTPEGIIEGMKTGELYWSTAVDAAITGEASSSAVIEGLKSMPDSEVRDEAARRFQVELQQKIKDAGVLMAGEADPLAGNPDLAAQARFVNEATGKRFDDYWQMIINRASAEKKTQLASE